MGGCVRATWWVEEGVCGINIDIQGGSKRVLCGGGAMKIGSTWILKVVLACGGLREILKVDQRGWYGRKGGWYV